MGLPEILSSPALAVLVSVSLLWTVSRLRVSSFLLLVLPKCPLLLRCRALHLRSFLVFPPSERMIGETLKQRRSALYVDLFVD